MKIRCICNTQTYGIRKRERVIDGLTIGKLYVGCYDCYPDANFLVFNDRREWCLYDVNLFEPEE